MGKQRLHGGRRLRKGRRVTPTAHHDSVSPRESDWTSATGPVFSRGAPSTVHSSSGFADRGCARRAGETDISARQHQHEDFKNPSAMLTAPTGNITNGEYLEWETMTGNTFCHGGFNYSNGVLVVPRNGIYRVFLQITYQRKGDPWCDHSDEMTLRNTVFVYRETYTKYMPLLSSVDTVSCSMTKWTKSLYAAGLFSLEANCRLTVTSSHPQLIVQKESEMFFGAELLPQLSGQAAVIT
ncbi:lymphotoxin-alpha-like isoform X2 [Morone saxatilis]|uniref:lymphotoxin-alpha-like isoform X2 n=1 Tax=Morone saxatilis TaxID=34816 RepID=UPI0015E22568|nr:lymphotoxin-alpha-like isoform X2 [Morone saxatilis]